MGTTADDRAEAPVRFETHPERYRHWRLDFPAEHGGAVARLAMDVEEDARPRARATRSSSTATTSASTSSSPTRSSACASSTPR